LHEDFYRAQSTIVRAIAGQAQVGDLLAPETTEEHLKLAAAALREESRWRAVASAQGWLTWLRSRGQAITTVHGLTAPIPSDLVRPGGVEIYHRLDVARYAICQSPLTGLTYLLHQTQRIVPGASEPSSLSAERAQEILNEIEDDMRAP
jgi:hypothetical protein